MSRNIIVLPCEIWHHISAISVDSWLILTLTAKNMAIPVANAKNIFITGIIDKRGVYHTVLRKNNKNIKISNGKLPSSITPNNVRSFRHLGPRKGKIMEIGHYDDSLVEIHLDDQNDDAFVITPYGGMLFDNTKLRQVTRISTDGTYHCTKY